MLLLINYANEVFRTSQRINTASGLSTGGFDRAISYSPKDIDPDFYHKNLKILSEKKGNGYWLWKPYLIKKSLQLIAPGDFLFYSDAGASFIASVKPLLEIFAPSSQDIIPFELEHAEKDWTKRDAFVLMDCDLPRYNQSKQRLASFILIRKSKLAEDFFNEFLNYAQDERIITDQDNQAGRPNYAGFKEHRHDQSIFSLLSKKYGFKAYRDPSQYGNQFKGLYPDSNYGQVIAHTRNRNLAPQRRLHKWFRKNEQA